MRKGAVLMWAIITLFVALAISGVFMAKTRKIGVDYTTLKNTVPDLKIKVCSLNALTLAASNISKNGVGDLEDIDEEASSLWNEFKNYVENVSKSSVEIDPDKYSTMTQVAESDSVIQEDCSGVNLSVMLYKNEDDGKYYLVSKASDGRRRDFSWAIGSGDDGGFGGGGGGDEDIEINVPPTHEDPVDGKNVDVNVNFDRFRSHSWLPWPMKMKKWPMSYDLEYVGSGSYGIKAKKSVTVNVISRGLSTARRKVFAVNYLRSRSFDEILGISAGDEVKFEFVNISGDRSVYINEKGVFGNIDCNKITGILAGENFKFRLINSNGRSSIIINEISCRKTLGVYAGNDAKFTFENTDKNVIINNNVNPEDSVAGVISKAFDFKTQTFSGYFLVNDITGGLGRGSNVCGVVTRNGDLKFDLKNFSGDIEVNKWNRLGFYSGFSKGTIYGLYSKGNVDLKGDTTSGYFNVNNFILRSFFSTVRAPRTLGIFSEGNSVIDGINHAGINKINIFKHMMPGGDSIIKGAVGIYARNGNLDIKNLFDFGINYFGIRHGHMIRYILKNEGIILGLYSMGNMTVDNVSNFHVNYSNASNVENDEKVYGMYSKSGSIEIKNSRDIKINDMNFASLSDPSAVAVYSSKDFKLSSVNGANFRGKVFVGKNFHIGDSNDINFYGRTCVKGDLDIKGSNNVHFYGTVCVKGNLKIKDSDVTFHDSVYVEGEVESDIEIPDLHEGEPCPFSCNLDTSNVDNINVNLDISECSGISGGGVKWKEVGG